MRRAQFNFGDCGERVRDWFHVAMRVQNLEQVIKGLPDRDERPSVGVLIDRLHSAKWHLWHGCPYSALQRLESLGWELAMVSSPEQVRLLARLEEFIGHLEINQSFIVNYGDRYRHGERIHLELRRIGGQPGGQQALCEAAADGMAAGSRACPSTGEDGDPE